VGIETYGRAKRSLQQTLLVMMHSMNRNFDAFALVERPALCWLSGAVCGRRSRNRRSREAHVHVPTNPFLRYCISSKSLHLLNYREHRILDAFPKH
jgi:hypothetical protein